MLGTSYRLAYALLDGTDKQHGVAVFDGCNVPNRVLEAVRSITGHAQAPLRVI
jgi:hypothetical protein